MWGCENWQRTQGQRPWWGWWWWPAWTWRLGEETHFIILSHSVLSITVTLTPPTHSLGAHSLTSYQFEPPVLTESCSPPQPLTTGWWLVCLCWSQWPGLSNLRSVHSLTTCFQMSNQHQIPGILGDGHSGVESSHGYKQDTRGELLRSLQGSDH